MIAEEHYGTMSITTGEMIDMDMYLLCIYICIFKYTYNYNSNNVHTY